MKFTQRNKASIRWGHIIAAICLLAGLLAADAVKSSAPGNGPGSQEEKKMFIKSRAETAAKTVTMYNIFLGDKIEAAGGEGPTYLGNINLEEQMEFETPPDFDINQIFSLSPTVFKDKKANSKIYYYLPKNYFLSWDKEDGYLLRFYYKGEVTPEEQKKIHIDLWLTPGYDLKDYQLLKELIGIKTGSKVKELLRLPADYTLSLQLGAHEIPENQVTISGIDSDTGELHITIETDVVTKQMLEDQLKDLGWGATMSINPTSYSDSSASIPVQNKTINIRLCDREAFAQKVWRRNPGEFTTFTNEFDFPLKLSHLYFLRKIGGQKLKVFGYDLGDAVLSPGQSAKVRNNKISNLLEDGNTIKAWYDFRLIPDKGFLDQVMAVITGGVGEVPIKTLNVVAVNAAEVFNKFSIYEISVQVNSIHFDPKGEKSILKKYKLTSDKPEISADPLYLIAKPGEEPVAPLSLFKYKISIVDKAANTYTDEAWREGGEGEETIYIGEKHVKELMKIEGTPPSEKTAEKPAAEKKEETAAPPAESAEFKVAQIDPSSVVEGQPFVLKILGSGFQLGAKVFIEVNINAGTDQPPEYAFKEFEGVFIDSTQIQISFDRGFSADPSERKIYVQNPDGRQSEVKTLKITSGTSL